MKKYFVNWNFVRMLRLALGIFIVVQGIQDRQWLLAVMGVAFSLMAVLNLGCNGSASCATPNARHNKRVEDVQYEDVK